MSDNISYFQSVDVIPFLQHRCKQGECISHYVESVYHKSSLVARITRLEVR